MRWYLPLALLSACHRTLPDSGAPEASGILFVTQVPVSRNGDTTRGGGCSGVSGAFGSQTPLTDCAPRGGSLMLRHPDGTLRDLTAEAGFGEPEQFQGARGIAVREPCVHWSGERALFAMVVGAPEHRGAFAESHWQIYEVTGLGVGQTASIRYVDGQPADFDNVSPVYGSDDRILFASSRPRNGAFGGYQRDEYETTPSVFGIYALHDESLDLIEHAPSGAFDLFVDSFGRVLFTKWDHLQRDQLAATPGAREQFMPVTFPGEDEDEIYDALPEDELFPEPNSPMDGAPSYRFNQFFPWEVGQDGHGEETLLHLGRHELGGTDLEVFVRDPSLSTESGFDAANPIRMHFGDGLFQLREDPNQRGLFYAAAGYEFFGGGGGALVRFDATPGTNPESFTMERLDGRTTGDFDDRDGTFRNPLPMTDGTLIASYTRSTDPLVDVGSPGSPAYDFEYRLVEVEADGGRGDELTHGIRRSVAWWGTEGWTEWEGDLWEIDPVEVVARDVPPFAASAPDPIEARVFAEAGVDVDAFRDWLVEHDLALIVVRDATQRDRADRQQPYNLRVAGGGRESAVSGPVHEIQWLQVLQADLVRGYLGIPGPTEPGRRPLARPMHPDGVELEPDAPAGSVRVAPDGSVAALVPARRALSWQLVGEEGVPVVRERYWVSFAPGEIRTCPACHGINTVSQTGDPPPTQEAEALRILLAGWSP